MLVRETPLLIDGPCGQLEALYLDVADARGAVLICHPNPVQGGTMLNKVVSTLQRTARDAGYVTLRFNYRGVGQSAGSHDMGAGEVADAEFSSWVARRTPAGRWADPPEIAGAAVFLASPASRHVTGETLLVDTGCVVAYTPSVDFDIQFVGGVKTALFGGEGLFFATLRGPGTVWIQSLPFARLASRIFAAAPMSQGGSGRGGEQGGLAGGLLGGSLLGGFIGGDRD